MMKWRTLFWIILIAVSGTTLFSISYTVKTRQKELSSVRHDVAKAREEARVLSAEWSYLNQPARLEALVRRFTALQPMKHQQIATIERIPLYAPDAVQTADASPAPSSPAPILASTH